MRKLITFIIFCMMTIYATGQNVNPGYDSLLAKKLGADDYGMKSYIMVILKTGSNEIKDQVVLDSLFAGHFANMNRMASEGKLVVAGPLGENNKLYRGIFILNITTSEEANALLQFDPTIKEKVLEAELYKWYGSAALSEYLKIHDKIEKYKIK